MVEAVNQQTSSTVLRLGGLLLPVLVLVHPQMGFDTLRHKIIKAMGLSLW